MSSSLFSPSGESNGLCPVSQLIYVMHRFAQALTGLDVATERRQSVELVVNSLAQGLLGSPAFDLYARGSASYPFGMILYYLCESPMILSNWKVLISSPSSSGSIMVLIILLNILVRTVPLYGRQSLNGTRLARSLCSEVPTRNVPVSTVRSPTACCTDAC